MVEKRLIDASAFIVFLERKTRCAYPNMFPGLLESIDLAKDFPAADAVEVVRCKDCQHGVFDAGKGVWKCVESAEWDGVTGDWIGPVIYRPRDFYCANGERRWRSEY